MKKFHNPPSIPTHTLGEDCYGHTIGGRYCSAILVRATEVTSLYDSVRQSVNHLVNEDFKNEDSLKNEDDIKYEDD